MGFYGNVFYEMRNAFSKLIVKRSVNSSDETTLAVRGVEGEITLMPTNKWIELSADPTSVECGISHKSGIEAGTAISFDKVKAEDVPENVLTLDLGQVFKTVSIDYDEAGHITNIENQYLKLPITDTEAEIGTLNQDVAQLKLNDANKEARLGAVEGTIGSYDNTIGGFETRIVDMETQLDEELDPMVEEWSKVRPWLGEQSEIAAEPNNPNDSTTITGAIGNIFKAAGEIGVKEEDKNIGGCLRKLNEKLETNKTQVEVNLTATKVAFERLITELNKQLETPINVDLWKP